MKQPQQIFIFDTTLRDGQQSPGAGMSFEDNLTYAQYADELGIDVLEAGFPSASRHDFEIVYAIANQLAAAKSAMKIAALCQLREEQIEQTMAALEPCLTRGKARLHTYVPVDPYLMKASLGKKAEDLLEIVATVYRLVKIAVDAGFEVEFTPEGYSRMRHHFDFTSDVIRAAISAGAKVINCPDTIGGASKWQGDAYFVEHMKKHADMMTQEFPHRSLIWSAHTHNDLGLALENSMNAVFNGPARQIEACMNGVGERAGNAALEQCLMIIDQFGQEAHPDFAFFTGARLQHLSKISHFIAEKMLIRQPHWPITGENAARHSSGGHTNAILKNPLAYQPFDPKKTGNQISFVFGPLSGSNHAKNILEKHGFACSEHEKNIIAQAIKDRYAERRKGITEEELIAAYQAYRAPIQVSDIIYSKDQENKVSLKVYGKFFTEENLQVFCCGHNSALAALDQAVKKYFPSIKITDYRSNACSGSTVDAKCNATLIINLNGNENYIGKAIDGDINIAAVKAYIHAVNQAYIHHYFTSKGKRYAKEFN